MNRDELTAAIAARGRVIPVETSLGTLHVLRLSERAKVAYEDWLADDNGKVREGREATHRARLVQVALCDAEGRRLFGDTDADMESVRDLDADVVTALWQAARSAGGFRLSVEAAAKN